MTYEELKHTIRYCRVYARGLFRDKVENFEKNGMHRDFSDRTVKNCINCIDLNNLYVELNEHDYNGMQDDIKTFNTALNCILKHPTKNKIQIAKNMVNNYVFFENLDVTGYDYKK